MVVGIMCAAITYYTCCLSLMPCHNRNYIERRKYYMIDGYKNKTVRATIYYTFSGTQKKPTTKLCIDIFPTPAPKKKKFFGFECFFYDYIYHIVYLE